MDRTQRPPCPQRDRKSWQQELYLCRMSVLGISSLGSPMAHELSHPIPAHPADSGAGDRGAAGNSLREETGSRVSGYCVTPCRGAAASLLHTSCRASASGGSLSALGFVF